MCSEKKCIKIINQNDNVNQKKCFIKIIVHKEILHKNKIIHLNFLSRNKII